MYIKAICILAENIMVVKFKRKTSFKWIVILKKIFLKLLCLPVLNNRFQLSSLLNNAISSYD